MTPPFCPTCHAEDGDLNTETMDREGACTFGCGHRVDPDTKVCTACADHSANAYECETCGVRYEDWNGWAAEGQEPHVPHWTDAWPEGTPIRDIFAEND